MLKIHLLGQPHLFADGSAIRFAVRPKTLQLLAYLLLHRGSSLSRDSLAFTLWPDESESDARANLRRHLNHLMHAFPAPSRHHPWLLSESHSLQWNPSAEYWLDVAEFERLSGDSRTQSQAVALYAGDLLENVYDDWLIYERERLRDLYFANLMSLIRVHRTLRDFPRALDYAQQLLARDPLREDALRQLMTAQYETGDRAGALVAYEQFARRLWNELSVEPMPETIALRETILRNAILATGDQGTPTEEEGESTWPQHRPSSSILLPFVGRENEMSQLRAHWSRAARGHGSLLLLGGEAGIGKTRLTRELSLIAEHEGARVLYGGAVFGEPVPYQVFVKALRPALRMIAALNLDSTWLAALSPLLPELKNLQPNLALTELDGGWERARLFEALAQCLQALAQTRPLLLVLDDLHWASVSTIALLEFIARRARQHSLLILGTFREEETPRMHPLRDLSRRLSREQLLVHLTLTGLATQSVELLVREVAGLPPDDSLATRLTAESEGNPFFLGELIRDRIESGKDPDQTSPPTRVEQMIMHRVARLSPLARALAEVGAIVGTAFDLELISQVGGWNEAQVLDGLNELLDHQLVREATGATRSDYCFNHHLIQSAVYASIPEASRTRRHSRVARLMEQVNPTRLDEWASQVARHFERGEEFARAVDYYIHAARQAEAVFAHAEALNFFNRARVCAERAGLPEKLLAVLEGKGDVYRARGENLQAVESYARAVEIPTSNQALRAVLKVKLGGAWAVVGDERCIKYLEAALEELDPATQTDALAEATTLLGRYHHYRAQYSHAIELYERARLLAEPLDKARILVPLYGFLSGASAQMARFEASMEWARTCIALGERKKDRSAIGFGHEYLAEAAALLGRWQDTLASAAASSQVADETHDQLRSAWAKHAQAHGLRGQGNLHAAREIARSALREALYLGDGRLQVSAGIVLSLIENDLGLLASARANAQLAVTRADALGHLSHRCNARHALAYAELQSGRWAVAARLCEECTQWIGETENRLLLLYLGAVHALAYFGQGRLVQAAEVNDRHLALARECKSPHFEALALCVRGQIFMARKSWKQARHDFDAAINILDELGSHIELGRALYGRGRMSRTLGDAESACADFDRAREIFGTSNAQRDLQRIESQMDY